jgi:hypothetical protein
MFTRTLLLAVVLAAPLRAADVPAALPSETESIAYVNFRSIIDSDIMKKFALGQLKQALKQADAQKMLEEIGLDPLTDLDKMIIGFWGNDPQNMDAVAVMTGKFNGDKLLKAAEKAAADNGDKMSIVEEGDYKLVKISGDNGKPFFMSVVDEKTIVGATDKKIAAKSIEAVAKKMKPVMNKDLSALVLKQDEKASMWIIGVTDGKLKDVNIPEIPGVDAKALQTGLNNMKNVAMTVRLGEDVNVSITMGMKDADAADEMNVQLGKLIDLGKTFLPLLAQNQPQAQPVIDDLTKSIKVDTKEKDVTVKLKLSAAAIAKSAGSDDQ